MTVSDLRFRYCLGVSFMTLQDLGLDRARYSSWEPPPKDTCQQKFEICESFCFLQLLSVGLRFVWQPQAGTECPCHLVLYKIVVWAVGSRSVMAFGMQVAVHMH